jgi:DUF1680 family protein
VLLFLGWVSTPIGAWGSATAQHAAATPLAQVQPVGLDEVQWTGGFWAERLELCRRQMLPALWTIMAGTNYSQFYENFRIAAGLAQGRHRGAPFNDGDFYKWLEGACAVLATSRDAELEQRIEEVIAVIAKAQRADGYLHTPVLIAERNGDQSPHAPRPFHDPLQFEMYNLGHLMSAACVHQRVTGRTNLLAVACKAADFLDRTFHQRPAPGLTLAAICPAHYMGLVELYRTTRQPKYLELARTLFTMRQLVSDGTDDNQDRLHFAEQSEAAGHAVRANYLYAGAADLFLETGDAGLWKPLGRIWTNVVQCKMYVTGGCGALYDGASPDGAKSQQTIARVHQAYGRDYQLPNLTAHNETCANIGNVLWNWRMFLATGDARFMDVVELALYNSVLSGVSLDGTNFCYVNPLRSLTPMPVELRWGHRRAAFLSAFCCPPNLARILAEVGGLAYSKSPGEIWVNLYGSSRLKTMFSGGRGITLTQTTDYPWNGRVRVVIDECGDEAFALKCRLPGWAKSVGCRMNSQLTHVEARPASYFELRRNWCAGDVVDLEFAMPAQLLEANPVVEEIRDQVALKRGPVVYCLETAGLPPGVGLQQVTVPANVELVAHYDRGLLGGVVLLEGATLFRPAEAWEGQLYRGLQTAPAQPVTARFVPYFTWGNRGSGDMSVWLPLSRN